MNDPETLMSAFLESLGEHYDAIQIVASRFDGKQGTSLVAAGFGNYFARVQMCRDFGQAHDNNVLSTAMVSALKEEHDREMAADDEEDEE